MARRLNEWLHSWLLFWLAGAYLAFRLLVAFWPAGWWMSVERVVAFDGVANADVILDVDRVIHRPFRAEWSVLVRGYDGGRWVIWCTAHGAGNYIPTAALPDPLTLEWWTDGECVTPPPGRYMISTIWTIQGTHTLPDKVIQTASNVFEVR
jgi:hypothetical protein